jgi:hypothetical protein
MKTLAVAADLGSTQLRLKTLTSQDAARWGRMNVHQMVKHLCDSMSVPLGELTVSKASMPQIQRTLMKWGALYAPFKWPRNVPTRPEIDQCGLHRPLNDFELDVQTAVDLIRRLGDADLEGIVTRILDGLAAPNGSDGAGCMLTIICANSDASQNVRASGPGAAALRSRMTVAIA